MKLLEGLKNNQWAYVGLRCTAALAGSFGLGFLGFFLGIFIGGNSPLGYEKGGTIGFLLGVSVGNLFILHYLETKKYKKAPNVHLGLITALSFVINLFIFEKIESGWVFLLIWLLPTMLGMCTILVNRNRI